MCDMISATMGVLTVVSAVAGGVSAYQGAQAQKASARAQQAQAEASAREAERQAQIESQRAAITQEQGERDAANRMRLLSQDIGSNYANFAGNGLLVDGNSNGTVADVLRTTTKEGLADIATINENTKNKLWEHQNNIASLQASAGNYRLQGQNAYSVGTAQANASKVSAIGSTIGGIGSAVGGAAGIHNSIGGKTILGYNVPK